MTDTPLDTADGAHDPMLRSRLNERVAARAHPDGPAPVHDSEPVGQLPPELDQLLGSAAAARLGLLSPRA